MGRGGRISQRDRKIPLRAVVSMFSGRSHRHVVDILLSDEQEISIRLLRFFERTWISLFPEKFISVFANSRKQMIPGARSLLRTPSIAINGRLICKGVSNIRNIMLFIEIHGKTLTPYGAGGFSGAAWLLICKGRAFILVSV